MEEEDDDDAMEDFAQGAGRMSDSEDGRVLQPVSNDVFRADFGWSSLALYLVVTFTRST